MPQLNAIGDAPIEPAFAIQMQAIGLALEEILNGKNTAPTARRVAFVLMAVRSKDADGQGRCNYISNAGREEVMALLKEQLAIFNGCPDIKDSA
jgi:hypothetical protein